MSSRRAVHSATPASLEIDLFLILLQVDFDANNVHVHSGDMLGLMKLNDSFPVPYLSNNIQVSHIWCHAIDINEEYPNTTDILEFDLTKFTYTFLLTVRFWVDIKGFNNDTKILFENKHKAKVNDNRNDVHKGNINHNNLESKSAEMSVREAKNTNEEINITMNYKEITEGNDREYSDSVTEVHDDENSESEYKFEATTELTEDNSSDVMDRIGMIIHI